MNYQNNTYGTDLLLAITSLGEPYLDQKKHFQSELSESFIQTKINQEMEAQYLMSEYYDTNITSYYSNLYRVCTLRELDTNRSIEDEGEDTKGNTTDNVNYSSNLMKNEDAYDHSIKSD